MALATIRNVIYNDEHYLDGVKVIGVDEHHCSHNQHT
ncbi:hypothetical protein CDBH8_0615 [Corynebacterium diphtheriae BH8]|nr:hypothetical protein CDBH8_0615 [Corynebacterium diphtheriae BH8]